MNGMTSRLSEADGKHGSLKAEFREDRLVIHEDAVNELVNDRGRSEGAGYSAQILLQCTTGPDLTHSTASLPVGFCFIPQSSATKCLYFRDPISFIHS